MSIVHLKPGSRQPVLAQGNPVSPQMFEFRKELKEEFYEMAKSNSLVRGEPPPGVTAFVALQFVSESENRRVSSEVASVNGSVRAIYEKILKTCGQFYKPNDNRTMLILSKDNRWISKQYNPEILAKPFTLVLQNSSSMPESKALRTQFVLDIGQRFPNQFPPEQIAEMLDLGQSEKMMDLLSKAARAAEDENEVILDGTAIPDPEPWEQLIVHWNIHVKEIQDIGFKTQSSPQVQEAMRNHILATEMLIAQQIPKSPAFAQAVMTQCPQFPIFFEQPPALPPGMQMAAQGAVHDSANLGKPQQSNVLPGDPAYQETKPPPAGLP